MFDLDGVLTRTAMVHAAAWKEMFDAFLQSWAARNGERFVAFDPHGDYDRYVDGRMRADGARAFLGSRGITLAEGEPNDPPSSETVHGLANRKNEVVLARLARRDIDVYDSSVDYVRAARDAGLLRAVVSSSANTAEVLNAAGIADLFQACIDGVVIAERHLAGKPAPDAFLAAADALALAPPEAAVFEDALAGVEAGRAGGFGYIVGVDRVGQADDLLAHGADIVVTDLAALLGRS